MHASFVLKRPSINNGTWLMVLSVRVWDERENVRCWTFIRRAVSQGHHLQPRGRGFIMPGLLRECFPADEWLALLRTDNSARCSSMKMSQHAATCRQLTDKDSSEVVILARRHRLLNDHQIPFLVCYNVPETLYHGRCIYLYYLFMSHSTFYCMLFSHYFCSSWQVNCIA
jgi:hypothetical protein